MYRWLCHPAVTPILAGAWDLDNYYFARLWRGGADDFRFQGWDFHNGTQLVDDSQAVPEPNTFYEIRVDWSDDRTEMIVTLNDPDGEQRA